MTAAPGSGAAESAVPISTASAPAAAARSTSPVAAMPLSAIGFLEMWKHWRFYYVVVEQWNVRLPTPYLLRDARWGALPQISNLAAYAVWPICGLGHFMRNMLMLA